MGNTGTRDKKAENKNERGEKSEIMKVCVTVVSKKERQQRAPHSRVSKR
jgi:hypothetical protein